MTEERLEPSHTRDGVQSSVAPRHQLCGGCKSITLESLGCPLDMEGHAMRVFPPFPDAQETDLESIHGHIFHCKVGDLDSLRKHCALCAHIHQAIYRGDDLTTLLLRDRNSDIKLSYFKMLSNGTGCLRIYLSSLGGPDQVQGGRLLVANVMPMLLHVSVGPAEEEAFLHLGFGRQIMPPDSKIAFQRLKSQLTECKNNHKACWLTHSGVNCKSDTPLPTRLIYIDPGDDDSVYLQETNGSRDKYIALSYCWGSNEQPDEIKLTTKSFDSLKKGITVAKLPKTIRDAIVITKKLGFLFLWVDRLCIIQDDLADWEAEAGLMSMVYEFAVLTIAAVGADNPNEGCFLHRIPDQAAVLPTEAGDIYISQMPHGVLKTQKSPGLASELKDARWAARAWTFQERMFSRRIVYYGEHQIIWECRQGIETESKFGVDAGFHYRCGQFSRSSDPKSKLNSLVPLRECLKHMHDSEANNTPRTSFLSDILAWNELISSYSMLDLTYEKDRLPALGSLMKMLKDNTGVDFCAGLCLDGIQSGLFWWPVTGDDRNIEMFFNGSTPVTLYWDLDRPFEGCLERPWHLDPRCTKLWVEDNASYVFWGRPGSNRIRESRVGAPTWSWLSAGSPVAFYPFFERGSFSIDDAKFIHTIPPKLECSAHVFGACRTRMRWPQPAINSSLKRFEQLASPQNHGTHLQLRWEGPVYGLCVPGLSRESHDYNGFVLFDESSGKLPDPDDHDPPGTFHCMIVGSADDPGDSASGRGAASCMFMIMIQPTNEHEEYRRLGVAYLRLKPSSDILAERLVKRVIRLV